MKWKKFFHLKEMTLGWKCRKKKERRRNAPLPYTTSSMQRDAASRSISGLVRLWWLSSIKVSNIGSGVQGLITYMRTDSTRDQLQMKLLIITDRFGAKYSKRGSGIKAGLIRPVSLIHQKACAKYLDKDQLKLYTLIWNRFCCQPNDLAAVFDTMNVKKLGLKWIFQLRPMEIQVEIWWLSSYCNDSDKKK